MNVAVQLTLRPEGEGDVLALAKAMVAQGARSLVLRDVGDVPDRVDALVRLIAPLGASLILDGGVADGASVERVAGLPLSGVVLGMGSLADPMLVRWAGDLLGNRMIMELNVDGDYLFDPPPGEFATELHKAVGRLKMQGVGLVLYRDVTGESLPLHRLTHITAALGTRVVFSGHIRSEDDLRELTVLPPKLRTVVIGDPVFDGRISIRRANEICETMHVGE